MIPWLWWWFLEKVIIFVAFFSTFIFIRFAAGAVRRFLAHEKSSERTTPSNILRFIAPSFLFAIYLWMLREYGNFIWISRSGILLSLLIDSIYFIGMLIYYVKIQRLRRSPAFFAPLVNLKGALETEGNKIVAEALKHIALQIPLLRRRFGNILTIRTGDFRRFLNSDWRFVDTVQEIPPPHSLRELSGFPHLIFADEDFVAPPVEDAQELIEDPQNFDYRKMYNFASWAANEDPVLSALKNNRVNQTIYVVNRTINTELSENLWKTSQNLICNTPDVIALNWRQFHFQESLRLRFVTLFNTSDLILRLISAIVFACARESGQFPIKDRYGRNQEIPRTTSEFNEALCWSLENSTDSRLDFLRQKLLLPRTDFDELMTKLEPIAAISGDFITDENTVRNTLTAWQMLIVLRNKIIGHGGIGWQLDLNPLLYLKSVHYYFLETVRDIAAFNLRVSPIEENAAASDQKDLSDIHFRSVDWRAIAGIPGTDKIVSVYPYVRYYKKRLLFFNRISSGKAEYIDYNASNITEPSFISFDEDLKIFKEGF